MTAKEYFCSIRAEVVKIQQASEMLERMRAKECGRAQSFEPRGKGGVSSPADAIASRIDFEGRLERRIADANAEVDEALVYLYGRDGRGGLAKVAGSRYADAVCMRYLQGESWRDMADVMRCSDKWCKELCSAAFVKIDAVGWAELKNA